MKAEEDRYIRDELGVKRLIRGGRTVPAQWEDAYEDGEPATDRAKAQDGPDTDKAQKEPDTTKSDNPITKAAQQRRRK
jgi:hypothetical protein